MKVCRNALDERLPDNVKEYLKKKQSSFNESNNESKLALPV